MYSFVNDLPEDGLQGQKHVGRTSPNYKYLLLHAKSAGLNIVYFLDWLIKINC
jgi:hypothetical protein